MKTINTKRNGVMARFYFACGLLVSLLAACSSPLLSNGGAVTASTGTVSVSINGGSAARTLLPTAPVFTKYALSFSSAAGTHSDVTITDSYTTEPLSLEAGDWTITARGYAMFGGAEAVVAEGSGTVTVANGGDALVTIAISALKTSGVDGSFSYSIEVPQGLTADTCDIDLVSADGAITVIDSSLDVDSSSATVTLIDTVSCEPGYYLLTVKLNDSAAGQSAARMEVVHIYSSLTTEGAFSFSAADFVPTVTLSGTAAVNLNGTAASDVILRAYSNAALSYTDMIGEVTVEADGTWAMAVDARNDPLTVYFQAIIYDHEIYRQFDTTIIVTDEDVAGIALSMDLSRITVSGTLSVSVNEAAYELPAYSWYVVASLGNENVAWKPCASDGSWSFDIDALDEAGDISFRVAVSDSSLGFTDPLSTGTIVSVQDNDVGGIALELDLLNLSGSLTLSNNGAAVSSWGYMQIFAMPDDDGYSYNDAIGSVSIPSDTTDWSMLIQAPAPSSTIYFYVQGRISEVWNEGYAPQTVTVGTGPYDSLALTLNMIDATVSGTVDGVPSADESWIVVASDRSPDRVFSLTYLEFYSIVNCDVAADGTWSMRLPSEYFGQPVWLWLAKVEGMFATEGYYLPASVSFDGAGLSGVALDSASMSQLPTYTMSGTLSAGAVADAGSSFQIALLPSEDIDDYPYGYGVFAFEAGASQLSWSLDIPAYSSPYIAYIFVITENEDIYMVADPVFIGTEEVSGVELVLSDMQ